MYPTLLVLGTVSYNKLEVRRDFSLVMNIFRLLQPRSVAVGGAVRNRYVWRSVVTAVSVCGNRERALVKKALFSRMLLNLNIITFWKKSVAHSANSE